MRDGVKLYKDFLDIRPGAGIYQRDFGFYSLERWTREGHINEKTDFNELFSYDPPGYYSMRHAGWCEAEFFPSFEVKILEDRGEHEVEQDFAGRKVLYFKNRRSGFMPEYIDHPVKDERTWEELCFWRMQKDTPGRFDYLAGEESAIMEAAAKGMHMVQCVGGGYMYLRSLVGPLELLFMFYDNPRLIHRMMEAWFDLYDAVAENHQAITDVDEFFIGEDICYNHGCLISHDMVREFLFPYYQQLMTNIKKRNRDKTRHLYFQVDTDGYSESVIDLYREIGMDFCSPFEVASNNDVVRVGRNYPDLLIEGGIDKRVLAQGKDEIDRMVESILPAMKARGGYIPTCDHGVPEEVSFENYMHFRKRILEYK